MGFKLRSESLSNLLNPGGQEIKPVDLGEIKKWSDVSGYEEYETGTTPKGTRRGETKEGYEVSMRPIDPGVTPKKTKVKKPSTETYHAHSTWDNLTSKQKKAYKKQGIETRDDYIARFES